MSYELSQEKVHDLVYTRINGNSIKGNTTYMAMLKSVTRSDIRDYAATWSYDLFTALNGTKLEMIEQIKEDKIK